MVLIGNFKKIIKVNSKRFDKRGFQFLPAIDNQGHQGVGRTLLADFYLNQNLPVLDQKRRRDFGNGKV